MRKNKVLIFILIGLIALVVLLVVIKPWGRNKSGQAEKSTGSGSYNIETDSNVADPMVTDDNKSSKSDESETAKETGNTEEVSDTTSLTLETKTSASEDETDNGDFPDQDEIDDEIVIEYNEENSVNGD